MDCRIIFYSARKTSFCERAIKKSFSELELTPKATSFATDRVALGRLITEAFSRCDISFVIGGLGFGDNRNIGEIISYAAADSELDDCKRLRNEQGDDGLLLRANNQLLIMLPDEPEQIESIMQGHMSKYIKATKQI